MKKVTKLKRRRRFSWWKKLIVLGVLLVVGYFLLFDVFRLNHVIVEGSDRYTQEELKDYMVTGNLEQNSLYFYLKYKYKEIPQIPFIEDIDVELVDKNTVKLKVYEKVVTGCVEFMGEYMYFDKDGIIVETSTEREEGVPLVVGLNFTRIAIHEQLKVQKQSLFETILDLTKLIHQYQLDIDTIAFDSNYEVTLTCGKSKVLLGKHDFYDVPLSQLSNILAASDGVAYSYDMRNYTEAGQDFIATKLE